MSTLAHSVRVIDLAAPSIPQCWGTCDPCPTSNRVVWHTGGGAVEPCEFEDSKSPSLRFKRGKGQAGIEGASGVVAPDLG